jgi:ceramide glucosyltransferase
MAEAVLLVLVVAGWIYWAVACRLVRAFFRAPHQAPSGFTPPVSILKPLRGLDPQIYCNFASFCQQDYPDFELLFGVEERDDPVVEVVERLQREHPKRSIQLFVIPATQTNRKASILHGLAAEAHHEILVVSDSDMRVTPAYLRRVVAPLADPAVGLVTCPYRGRDPATLTARLEALYMGVTFLPSVLVGREVLEMRFAMGATVALRRSDLARIGGFAAVADYLADDHQLGAQIARLGLRVCLSDYIVETVLDGTTFREEWDREVRWSHCNWVSRPLEYPGLLLTFTTPFALFYLAASGFDLAGWAVLAVSLLLRWLVAWAVTGYTGNEALRRWFIWLPVRDMLTAVVWLMGAVGRRVVWRGERYILLPDGRLESTAAARRHALGDAE